MAKSNEKATKPDVKLPAPKPPSGMRSEELRAATEKQMTCLCGEPLAIIRRVGVVCCDPTCQRRKSKQVEIGDFTVPIGRLRRAWPDRILAHSKPLEARVTQFGAGIKRLC